MRKLANTVRADYFSETDYFKTDIVLGVTTNGSGKRVISLSEDFLSGFREALVDECGPAANEVLYSCGRMTGDMVGIRLANEVAEHYGQSVNALSISVFDTVIHSYFSHHGWGYFRSDYSSVNEGLILAEFDNTIFQAFTKNEERPIESLLAGLLAGLYSQISGQTLECVQTECLSQGASKSRFILGLADRIEQARPFVEAGDSHGVVIDKLSQIAA
ncbi:MAG: hypothetical protein P1V97_21355 [Planctomycetota bacterium]|nr:hypothetical protein [Planctomycetota bacterium]